MESIPSKCPLPFNPSHAIVIQNSGSRNKKDSLHLKLLDSARPLLTHNNPMPDKTKIAQDKNHTKTVQDAILNTPPNSVLHEPAPEISPEELTLPMPHQMTPPQLRSGHCIAQNNFGAAIGLTPDLYCPACGSGDPAPYPTFSPAPHTQWSLLHGTCGTTCPDSTLSVLHPFFSASLCSSPFPTKASTNGTRPLDARPYLWQKRAWRTGLGANHQQPLVRALPQTLFFYL